MKTTLFLTCGAALFFASCASPVAKQHILRDSYSPDKHIAIAEIGDESQTGNKFFFVDARTGKRLGDLVPADQRSTSSDEGISHVDIQEVTWDSSSNHVALALYYGTKLGELLIYSCDKSGTFNLVNVNTPNAMALFADHDLKWRQIENNSGYDEYNIGYWSHNTVNIISGTVKDVNNEAETADSIGFFVAYHVQVRDFVGIVMDPQLVGPIKGDEVDAFITKWMSDNGNRF